MSHRTGSGLCAMETGGEGVLERLGARGWTVAENHPLATLHGMRLDDTTVLALLGPMNRFGAHYLQLFLELDEGVSQGPALVGLFHQGPYPAYNWVEVISVARQVHFPATGSAGAGLRDVTGTGMEQGLFAGLAGLVPPGGHMMAEYESPPRWETAQALGRGVPPVATPLGYLLYSVGCGVGFRDWYFAEGGTEGPRKLQGFKALDEEHRRVKAAEMAVELLGFLHRPESGDYGDADEAARQRAAATLAQIAALTGGSTRREIELALERQGRK